MLGPFQSRKKYTKVSVHGLRSARSAAGSLVLRHPAPNYYPPEEDAGTRTATRYDLSHKQVDRQIVQRPPTTQYSAAAHPQVVET